MDKTDTFFHLLSRKALHPKNTPHQQTPDDFFLDSAYRIVRQCSVFEKDLETYRLDIECIDKRIQDYTAATSSAKIPHLFNPQTKAAHLKKVLKTLHQDIKKLEEMYIKSSSSDCVTQHRKNVIEYLFSRVWRDSSTFQHVESNFLLRENHLKILKSPSDLKCFSLDETIPPSHIKNFIDPYMAPCFCFVSRRWLTHMDSIQRENTASRHFPQNMKKNPWKGKQKHLSFSPTDDHVTFEDISDETQRNSSTGILPTSIVLDYQKHLHDHQATKEKQQPYQQVLSTLSDLQSLMDLFATEVVNQNELCDTVHQTAEDSLGHMTNATQELGKAKTQRLPYRYYLTIYYMMISVLLLLFDFLFSSRLI